MTSPSRAAICLGDRLANRWTAPPGLGFDGMGRHCSPGAPVILARVSSPDTQAPTAVSTEPARPVDRLPAEPALVMAGVSKRWPKADRPVLDGIGLEVDPGTVASIKGSNGAGKTTLLRIVAGLIKPDHGTVSLHGFDSERDARRYRSGVSLLSAGSTGLFARLSVRHHLRYWARLGFLSPDERERAVERMLDIFSLHDLASRRADRISMGQRQRVRLALTTLHEPRVLLLDEPANSLDDEGTALLHAAVETTRRDGGCVIWCAPKRDEGVRADRQLILREGRLA